MKIGVSLPVRELGDDIDLIVDFESKLDFTPKKKNLSTILV